MGCICTKDKNKPETSESPAKKTFSWDKKDKTLDLKNYVVENAVNNEVIRYPGSVNGEQFLIQNCRDSTIYIFDIINTVTIEDCNNCTIILGPVKASVYLRNCIGSVFVTACGQFRSRDCRKCQIFVHSATQPIIESSTGMKFGTFHLDYSALADHLLNAGLNLSINTWTEVYDFTPIQSDSNWCFIETDATKAVLKARSKGMETSLKELGATWLGKPPFSLAVESTV